MIKKLLFYLLLLFIPLNVDAHEFNPAHLVVKEIKNNSYEVEWMYPVKNIGARGEVFFPNSCKLVVLSTVPSVIVVTTVPSVLLIVYAISYIYL